MEIHKGQGDLAALTPHHAGVQCGLSTMKNVASSKKTTDNMNPT